MNKFLLIICEGTSDRVTLYLPTKNFINKKNITIKPEITHGDIALKEDATKESCQKMLKDLIDSYKKNYTLTASDFFGVVHIIDTDGAFSPNDIYVQTQKGYYFDEQNGLIHTEDIDLSKAINSQKREIYEYLLSLKQISNVDYKVLFFSRNLEHALYNKVGCSDKEKETLSDAFEDQYKDDADGFYKQMNDILFNVPNNYDDSWNHIMTGSNSIYRGSNFIILLDLLNNYKK